jgi:hypothetical protein
MIFASLYQDKEEKNICLFFLFVFSTSAKPTAAISSLPPD